MATPTLSNLGTQSTYKVYICDGNGAKGSSNGILANLQNTTDIRRILLEHASQNRALVYETTTYGYTNQEVDGTASAYKYFLADNNGVEGTVTADALDITPYITNGYKTALYPDATDLAASATAGDIINGYSQYERRGNIQVLELNTASSAVADDLYRIQEVNSQIADKDILIIVAVNYERKITVHDHSVETDEFTETTAGRNICLENGTNFSTGTAEAVKTYGSTTYDKSSLTLMWDATASLWVEINRTPSSVISRKTLRDANVVLPIEGTTNVTIDSGGGVTTLEDSSGVLDDNGTRKIQSGVDTSIYVFSGTATSSSHYTVEKPFGSALEGDKYTAVWKSDFTAVGDSAARVTIFGKLLTAAEAAQGSTNPIEIITRYVDGDWEDGVKSVNVDFLEDSLGTPTASGQVLTSTTAGVRSWIDAPAGMLVASATYDFAVNGGGAGTIVIGAEAFPINSIILADYAIIEMHTALSEASGTPTVSIGTTGGVGTDVDAFDAARNFNATPYSSATAVTRTAPGGSVTVVKSTSAVTNITVVIAVANLDAGKFTVHVPYIA